MESPVLFNIYIDFVLRCAEYEVLQKYPDTGLKYSFHIKSESTTREQRSLHGLSGIDRLRMLLYADDIILFCEDLLELQDIINIYDKTFRRFGLTIAIDKTKTLIFNVEENLKEAPSIISLRNLFKPIENVRQFKYLGHVLSNLNSPSSSFINHQMASAYSKWNEIKYILLDRKINLPIRIKFLETYVRSRLLYSVQAWTLSAVELNKIESVWHNFLRRMVKGGFSRKNVPLNNTEPIQGELDWSFKISKSQLIKITKSPSIKNFCLMQHLKYIAHITRMSNSSLQKRLLFAKHENRTICRWKKFAKYFEIDETQLRRLMMNRTEFLQLLDKTFK